MKRKVPRMKTDEEVEAFLAQDLSDLDFSQFKPARFEFEAKSAQINMRVPEALLDAVKQRARARGIPYTRYIREIMEQAVSQPPKARPAGARR
jgi:predicted DNA binding CopG/RHH family protein